MGKRGASNAPKAKPKPKAKQTPKAKPSPKAAKASARKRKAEPTSPTIAFKPVTRSDFDNLFGRSAAAQALSNTHGPAGSGVQRIEHMPPSVPNSPATIPEAVQPAAPGTNEGPAAEHQEPSPTNAADEAHETVLETQEAVEGVAVERREAAPAATLADSDAIDQSAMPLPSGKEPESHESHEEVEQMASAVSSPETLRKMRVSKNGKHIKDQLDGKVSLAGLITSCFNLAANGLLARWKEELSHFMYQSVEEQEWITVLNEAKQHTDLPGYIKHIQEEVLLGEPWEFADEDGDQLEDVIGLIMWVVEKNLPGYTRTGSSTELLLNETQLLV